jgi:alpha-glucosidase (family GH31 glycosyl hydrolase)
MRGAVLVAIAGAALALPATADAAPEVDAGGLRAEVTRDPWHLELTDARGDAVLSERAATGDGPAGTLGFRTVTGWEHATRVLDSGRNAGRFTATLATTDPGRTISVALSSTHEGVIDLEAEVLGAGPAVDAVGIGFDARSGERYLGFGERSNAVDQSGTVVENYVSDGPYQENEYPVINAFSPPWGIREGHPESTYYPVPWLLSTAGYGVLVDDPQTSYFRLRTDDPGAWSVEADALPADELGAPPADIQGPVRLRFFAGPKPADALRRFVEATGHQPKPAAPWLLGPWYQADDDERAEVALLQDADAPLSALQTYTHYLPCGDQVGNEAATADRVADAHGAGIAITTYFNPMICADYQPAYGRAAAAGALTADRLGQPYLYRYGADVDQAFRVSQFDFFSQAGRDEYATLLGEAVADGYDGWMEDFGEYTPLDSVSDPGGDPLPGTYTHNVYATRYHCAAYDAVRDAAHPVVRFQRSGWAGAAPCAQVVWGGDPTTSFGFDGLSSVVTQALSAGASGIGIYGSDIGGFFAIGDNSVTPELLTRWVQLGAVSPVMRTQANGVAVPSKERPQVSDPEQIDNWRRYAKLHTQLYPYLTAALRKYRRTGLPPMRHLALAYPADDRAAQADDEFLLGPDLLVAPVLEPGATRRSLYLPKGRWIDLWRSVAYRKGSGGLELSGARELRGKRDVSVPAPLDELPLLARAGAILPLLPPKVDTLARYGRGVRGLDTLEESRDELELLAFPRGDGKASFNNGEKLRSVARKDIWTLEVDGDHRRTYRLQASLAALDGGFEPCAVAVLGRTLPESKWSYDRRVRVLDARFTGTRTELQVFRCGTR